MHVLILPGAYPDEVKAHKGIFFKQQAKALKTTFGNELKVGIIAPDLRSLLEIKRLKELLRFGNYYRMDEADFPVLRKYSFNLLPGLWHYNRYIFTQHAFDLFEAYCKEYGKPDIIHAHIGLWAGYAAMKISQKHRIPYVITEHSSQVLSSKLNLWQKKSICKAYEKAAGLAAVSSGLRTQMQALSNRADIEVIPNMVDTSAFSIPTEERNPNMIVSVGNLFPVKGYDVLVEAFAICKKQNPSLKLRIAGAGPELPRLKQIAERLKIENDIEWLGRIAPSQINAFLHSGSIYVSPSRFETFGLSIAEAMATGMPAVATLSGGPQDFITPENGLLCKKNNPTQLAEAILSLVNSQKQFSPEKIRNTILENYSEMAVSNKNILLYKKHI